MKLVPMRFKGVSWRHNPRELTFVCEKQVRELHSPFGGSQLQNTGRKCIKIKGRGELYGADCLQQFEELLRLFKSGGSGVLAIPHLSPVRAVFESLTLEGDPKPDLLAYRFEFREEKPADDGITPREYTAAQGETMWDVSYRFGVEIDPLMRLNPDVKRPDIPLGGRAVRLC